MQKFKQNTYNDEFQNNDGLRMKKKTRFVLLADLIIQYVDVK